MKLYALGLAGGTALAIAAIWTLCSLMVMIFPSAMPAVTGWLIAIFYNLFVAD